MDSLRIVLIIIGLLVILAFLGHGLWTIRKNNQLARGEEEKLERKRRRAKEPADLFSAAEQVEVDEDDVPMIDPLAMKQARRPQRATGGNPGNDVTAAVDNKVEPTLEQIEIDLSERESDRALQNDMFDEMQVEQEEPRTVSAEEPPRAPEADALHTESQPSARTTAGTEDESDRDEETEDAAKAGQPESDIEVITLFVTGDIQGAILLQMTTELGLKYGDMDIFHRHQESSGHGPVLFSVANMFNPGTFDIHAMENFKTEGIVLFLTLPVEGDGHQAFTMMYNAANKIADAMPRAAVLDGNRNPVTKQSVQHTYQRIREFERKQRLQRSSGKRY